MPKIRRNNYIFIAWKGDHSPRHVHVYKDGKLMLKWDLDNSVAMAGTPRRDIIETIETLVEEGLL